MELSNLSKMMPIIDGFPRPDWDAIHAHLDNVPESDLHEAWCKFGRVWMQLTSESAGEAYKVSETENFFIVSKLHPGDSKLLNVFVEKARDVILYKLAGFASDEGYGKHVVLLFDNVDSYYEYVSYFQSKDGDYPMSSGMFLSGDYGHIAIPFLNFLETEATFAHEFTHSCLAHLPIPLWLNEGLAVTLEDELCGSKPLGMDKERMAEHKAFWDSTTIQEFWSGESFQRTDEGNELSYELGRYCVRALAHDLQEFSEFVNHASFEDGGQSAAIKIYEGSLGGLPFQFFGEGDWCPNPETWWSSEEPTSEAPSS